MNKPCFERNKDPAKRLQHDPVKAWRMVWGGAGGGGEGGLIIRLKFILRSGNNLSLDGFRSWEGWRIEKDYFWKALSMDDI